MAPAYSAKTEREKKLRSLLSFASKLTHRLRKPHDASLLEDIRSYLHGLPLQASSTVATKQDELNRLGTELWNVSTTLRREDSRSDGRAANELAQRNRILCLVRVLAFLLLDTAAGQTAKPRDRKQCIRLSKIALKTARVCIESDELESATKVLERAADDQEALGKVADEGNCNELEVGQQLRIEYFAIRTTLAWRQDRIDTAEHMFARSKQLNFSIKPSTAETLADLFYEMGKDFAAKRKYELSVRWLERAYDALAEKELDELGPEAGEVRLSIMQSIVHTYMKLKTPEAQNKISDMMSLLETDYGDKMAVQLLKLELFSASESVDSMQYYSVLLRLIRSVVLNGTNFKTILHHVHKLKDHSNATACKVLDDLIDLRLFREENQDWIERAVVTRIWISTSSALIDHDLESLQGLFDALLRNGNYRLSAPATHAAQTLLWKRVEIAYTQEQFELAENWCRHCLHPIFEKAGELNKIKIARKVILCALSRQDYAAAREVFTKMSDNGRDDPTTRYLMYKLALHSDDDEFAAESLDVIGRQSSTDASVLYACVIEAQSFGNRRQATIALEKVLDKYDHGTPQGIHLPALLRCTIRLLTSEISKSKIITSEVAEELCKVFDGGKACLHAKASRQRPSTPDQRLFTPAEFEWFSKNTYNLSLKYCSDMHPAQLVRLLNACIEFIKLLNDQERPGDTDLPLRLMFCHFLAACACTTLARAEDNIKNSLQHYFLVRKHSREFRRTADEELKSETLGKSAQADIITKHFQTVKLELEATLKLEDWDSLDALFEECWKYKNPAHLETLADLVLVMHSCITKTNVDGKYQSKLLIVLQKIVNLTLLQTNNDIKKLSRWVRCLYQLALTFDETFSLNCLDQASQIAAARQGVSLCSNLEHLTKQDSPSASTSTGHADDKAKEPSHYPSTELEWLATTSFNRAVDYYLQENDEKCKIWAEKGIALAQWAEDGGALRDMLMEKYSGLVWQE